MAGLAVLIDGVDVTARGKVETGTAANVRSWIYWDAGLGIDGPRVFTASATGTSGGAAIAGTARSTVTIRAWDQRQRRTGAAQTLLDSGAEFAGAARKAFRVREESFASVEPAAEELHLGALNPAYHRAPGALAASTQHKAKNVILLIGDGMGAAHRTAARVLSPILSFTESVGANGNGYPDNPDTGRKLIVNFGAGSDRYEDWMSAVEHKDPGVTQIGVAVANPNDPDRSATGGYLVVGVFENGANGGEAQPQAVHTLSDVPSSAYGPGASQLARASDNAEAFFYIVKAMLGTYPTPIQYRHDRRRAGGGRPQGRPSCAEMAT